MYTNTFQCSQRKETNRIIITERREKVDSGNKYKKLHNILSTRILTGKVCGKVSLSLIMNQESQMYSLSLSSRA